MKKNTFGIIIFLSTFLFFIPNSGRASQYKEISAPVVKNMLEKGDAVAINLLSHLEYDLHHITGSINIPINELQTSDQLPKDLSTPVIFYCMGFR